MDAKPKIIYTNDDFAVINKPPGISMHGGNRIVGPTLADWIVRRFPETRIVGDDPIMRPGIVHRLDKDTSGVVVIARSQRAFEYLKNLFKNRRVEKTYLALVAGRVAKKSGVIDLKIGRLIKNPAIRGTENQRIKNEREARTEYRVLEYLPGFAPSPENGTAPHGSQKYFSASEKDGTNKYKESPNGRKTIVPFFGAGLTLIEVTPKTGRMHQIRVHFSALAHPVAGDRIYGKNVKSPAGLNRQFLHASSISFSYPDGKRWRFEAPVPEDLTVVLAELRRLRRRSK